jgi:hypothetical protein
MKLAFTFVNATIDKIIKTLFHNAQFELWDCEIYIYLDIPTSNYFNVKLALLIEKVVQGSKLQRVYVTSPNMTFSLMY